MRRSPWQRLRTDATLLQRGAAYARSGRSPTASSAARRERRPRAVSTAATADPRRRAGRRPGVPRAEAPRECASRALRRRGGAGAAARRPRPRRRRSRAAAVRRARARRRRRQTHATRTDCARGLVRAGGLPKHATATSLQTAAIVRAEHWLRAHAPISTRWLTRTELAPTRAARCAIRRRRPTPTAVGGRTGVEAALLMWQALLIARALQTGADGGAPRQPPTRGDACAVNAARPARTAPRALASGAGEPRRRRRAPARWSTAAAAAAGRRLGGDAGEANAARSTPLRRLSPASRPWDWRERTGVRVTSRRRDRTRRIHRRAGMPPSLRAALRRHSSAAATHAVGTRSGRQAARLSRAPRHGRGTGMRQSPPGRHRRGARSRSDARPPALGAGGTRARGSTGAPVRGLVRGDLRARVRCWASACDSRSASAPRCFAAGRRLLRGGRAPRGARRRRCGRWKAAGGGGEARRSTSASSAAASWMIGGAPGEVVPPSTPFSSRASHRRARCGSRSRCELLDARGAAAARRATRRRRRA